jgi:hypothetical protein
MRLRLILQPPWLRFLVWASLLAVLWGGLTSFQARAETESTILSAIVFGAAVAGYFTVTTQGVHRGALAAVSGLDQAQRTQAIDAVLHGVVPADPDVRASATRLGRVCLRNKSADQLKRQEILTWLVFGILIVASVAAAVVLVDDRFYYLVIAVLAAIVLPFSLLTMRRIQRNVALLAETPQ